MVLDVNGFQMSNKKLGSQVVTTKSHLPPAVARPRCVEEQSHLPAQTLI